MNLLQAATWQYNAYYRPELFDKALSVAGVDACLRFLPSETLVVFTGSRTLEDWWRDAEAIAPYTHPVLGVIPYGFALGADEFNVALVALLDPEKPVRAIAHSLGCPHGIYQIGLMLNKKFAAEQISMVGFEPPRSCSQGLLNALTLVKDIILTCNSDLEGDHDLVIDEPEWALHPRALTQIGSEPITGNIIIDKEIHAIQSVMVSCELLEAQSADVSP
jgi:hypothetical protein